MMKLKVMHRHGFWSIWKPHKKGYPSQRVVKNKKNKVVATMNPVVVKKIKQEKTDNATEETWSNLAANLADAAIGKALTALEDKIKNLDAWTSKSRRIPQLSKSQKLPYVGSSTVKRIIKTVEGVVPSPVMYDAFKTVEEEKLKTLMDFLKLAEEQPTLKPEADERFYWTIILPRVEWPDDKYGWLNDRHIGAA